MLGDVKFESNFKMMNSIILETQSKFDQRNGKCQLIQGVGIFLVFVLSLKWGHGVKVLYDSIQ